MEDTTESDPREVEAAKYNLNYVQVRKMNNIKQRGLRSVVNCLKMIPIHLTFHNFKLGAMAMMLL